MSCTFSTELGSNLAISQAKLTAVLNSPLWKPVFRHQICPELELEASWPTHPHQDGKEVLTLLTLFCLGGALCLVSTALRYKPLWDCQLLEAEADIVIFVLTVQQGPKYSVCLEVWNERLSRYSWYSENLSCCPLTEGGCASSACRPTL